MNVDPIKSSDLTIDLKGQSISTVTGRILTSPNVSDHNTFDNPDKVKPADFNDANIRRNVVTVKIPAKSVVVLEIK